ncbi:MAG: hypothetical protein HDR94_04755 [Bacteroides sp.]|nr:hypothetical protein [Bacteroides sp.]
MSLKEIIKEIIEIVLITIPFWILLGPIIIILKTLATIFQPYLYRREQTDWYKSIAEDTRKGIFHDYPPSYGRLFGVGPWNKRDFQADEDDPLD